MFASKTTLENNSENVITKSLSGNEIKAEKIIDKKVENNKVYYKIKWEGKDIINSTWEEASKEDIKSLVNEYEKTKINKKLLSKEINYKTTIPDDYDPDRVITVKRIDNKLCCLVRWKEDAYGIQPDDCFIPTEVMKENYSLLLIEFYETKIKFTK